jgi:hypothetical protein
MKLSREECINFFNFIEKQSAFDNKITLSDLKAAVAVDTDGDGMITDKQQTRIMKGKDVDGNEIDIITTWTEVEIMNRMTNLWIENAGDKWLNDQALDVDEFLEIVWRQ